MTVSEKVAYLRGLMEGLDIDPKSKEGKIYAGILDVLGSLASDMEDIEANAAATADAVNDISEDLGYIEDFVDALEEDEDDEDYEDEDEDEDCGCCCCTCDSEEEDDDLTDDDEDETIDLDGSQMYEVTCPACGDVVTVDENILSLGKIECPGCGNILEFDLGDDEE